MKKISIFSLFLIGAVGLFTACEKDGDKVVMSDNPVAPTLTVMPDLNLQRINGLNILSFEGTEMDPGFQASATYSLEACAKDNNFADVVSIASDVVPSFKISVSDLNGILVKKFPADQQSDLDFRIKAMLVVDHGGATSPVKKDYYSATKSALVTLYGLPRLDLLSSGATQKIESPLGNGVYSGYVKLDPLAPFTF
ncbi:MAG: SusE domain-containing protein, partial [Bacteroidales bacterium]|nr:SusE domain-containing protein [Bacteroidales bacterium]